MMNPNDDDFFAGTPASKPIAPKTEAPPTEKNVAWGCVERNCVPAGASESHSVTRIVVAGVDYNRPPGVRPWSKPSEQIFTLTWPTDPTKVQTLACLGEGLRDARAAASARLLALKDPRVILLDQAIDRFLQLLEELHQQRWTIGLVHPSNLILLQIGADTQIVPVDLGFYWLGSFAEPGWLSGHPGQGSYWQESASERQLAWSETSLPSEKVAADIQAVARVVAGAILGTPDEKQFSDLPFWDVISEAMAGRIVKASDLRAALAQAPPSQHFCERPRVVAEPVKPLQALSNRSNAWPKAIAGLFLVAALGVIGYFAFKGPQSLPLPTPPGGGPDSRAGEMPTESEIAGWSLLPIDEMLANLNSLYGKLAEHEGPNIDAIRRLADGPRRKFFDDWKVRFQAVQTTAIPNHNPSVAQVKALINEYSDFITKYPPFDPELQKKEKQWYGFATTFLGQLQPR